jgi:ribonuclease-3
VSGTQTSASLESFEKNISHCFANIDILVEALTHSSYSNEHGGVKKHKCNERLEFLGDSVLSVITSEYLFSMYPDSPEGDLTRMRAELVCEKALAEYAEKISLGSFLYLGKGEERGGGRERKSILADAFEAVIAAVYLDAGADAAGKVAVSAYLMPLVEARLSRLLLEWHGADYKTLLQQLVQRSEGEVLDYITVDERGPDHAKIFTVEARLNSNIIGRGEGSTKRAAEQAAAKEALILFGELQ